MKNQPGSVHIVIIIILILAIVGSLSFIFWQNYSKEDETVQTAPQSNDKEGDQTEKTKDLQSVPDGYVSYNDKTVGFRLAYPEEWGDMKTTEFKSGTGRLGANGDVTSAVMSSDATMKIEVYTKDSFFTKNNAGYELRYQGDKLYGNYKNYDVPDPVDGTTIVYPHTFGGMEFQAHDLFFSVNDSVVYVSGIGESEDTRSEIAETVSVD